MLLKLAAQIRTSLMLLIIMTLLTGILYPYAITSIAQTFFPDEANGSLIIKNNQIIGSALIGQYFNSPNYFWGRPSATAPSPYNATHSMGSNLGPMNPLLLDEVKDRVNLLKLAHGSNELIPIDLVTASASGLDPDISPLAAYYQVSRIAKARGISEIELQILIQQQVKSRTFHLLGEPRVNVLKLNIALDQWILKRGSHGQQAP